MNLEQATIYTDKKLSNGEKSDGCTFAPNLGIKKWCIMHDMLRRFKPVSALEADNLFFKGILSEGKKYTPVAMIYWLAVRWTSMLGGNPLPATILLLLITSISLLAYVFR